MLEGAFIIIDIIIIIIGVSKEVIFNRKYIRSRDIDLRQVKTLRLSKFIKNK